MVVVVCLGLRVLPVGVVVIVTVGGRLCRGIVGWGVAMAASGAVIVIVVVITGVVMMAVVIIVVVIVVVVIIIVIIVPSVDVGTGPGWGPRSCWSLVGRRSSWALWTETSASDLVSTWLLSSVSSLIRRVVVGHVLSWDDGWSARVLSRWTW